jgi:hypothetical protein
MLFTATVDRATDLVVLPPDRRLGARRVVPTAEVASELPRDVEPLVLVA